MSFVGAGGKTSLLLHLARELATDERPVLVTTTTHLADPCEEPGAPVERVLHFPALERPGDDAPLPARDPGVTLLVSRPAEPARKLKGIDPSHVARLASVWPVVLVEADGSKRLPIKAPAEHEPVVPAGTGLTVGVLGLDALGWPMDERTVHRPEHFAAVAGCLPGAAIGWDHVVALARHPEGLFKRARGARVVLLNKVDESPYLPSPGQLRALGADLVLLSGADEAERVFFTIPPGPAA
ncbi:MAG TPA: selenium cofactor biosynthesis protein YqeC [Thermoanaerobaculia bacterium]|nr:selenium cofactor biosynthesis protein YqeC [Thermoanaerobaculia bacterium]HQN09406.1 selenium cofactor biosynthesis protein YqeC [Thermoanaerobaculia bacterium]HQP88058.1 selenium cofactor biosynthesis protein YqeC [Thermoanaerobaculia bacterium]